MYLRPSFNTPCLRLFYAENILLESAKVLWKNKRSLQSKRRWFSSKGVFYCCILDMMKEVTFFIEVQDMLSYQHGFCMKKVCAFNANIKYFNELKTSDEEQSKKFNCWKTTNTWRRRLYIYIEALKKQNTTHSRKSFFLVKNFL